MSARQAGVRFKIIDISLQELSNEDTWLKLITILGIGDCEHLVYSRNWDQPSDPVSDFPLPIGAGAMCVYLVVEDVRSWHDLTKRKEGKRKAHCWVGEDALSVHRAAYETCVKGALLELEANWTEAGSDK